MAKRLRVMAIVAFILIVFNGTASAYTENSKKIELIDDGTRKYYVTEVETVADLLEEQDIDLSDGDQINLSMDDILSDQDIITITRSRSVIINLDGVPRMVNTKEKTVGDLMSTLDDLVDTSFVLDNVDEDTLLNSNMVINLISTIEKEYTTTEEIPFETEVIENDNLPYGTEQVVQEGSTGELEITMKEVYQGDELISSDEIDRKTIKEPVNAVIEKGTEKSVETHNGNFDYSRALNVTATGYTAYDPGCNGTTASGLPAKRGVIAVDTNVIPMGSRVFIPGYGEAIAADTGGAIRGNKIDLCYDTVSEAYDWGVRNVTIYVLD